MPANTGTDIRCDGSDESGFGSENCCDWWFLDEYLTLPEGVGCIRNCSFHDADTSKERFHILHDQVAAARNRACPPVA